MRLNVSLARRASLPLSELRRATSALRASTHWRVLALARIVRAVSTPHRERSRARHAPRASTLLPTLRAVARVPLANTLAPATRRAQNAPQATRATAVPRRAPSARAARRPRRAKTRARTAQLVSSAAPARPSAGHRVQLELTRDWERPRAKSALEERIQQQVQRHALCASLGLTRAPRPARARRVPLAKFRALRPRAALNAMRRKVL